MRSAGVIIAGGGPAGLAAAIQAKRTLTAAGSDAAVVVVDKAPKAGCHSLSGGLLEAACLDKLIPGWRDKKSPFTEDMTTIQKDEMYFLTSKFAMRVPPPVVPGPMHHKGDMPVSVSRLAGFLAVEAEELGVEAYYGYSMAGLLVEDGRVTGVRLAEAGLDKEGRPQSNYLPQEELRAPVTIIADGSKGVVSAEFRELFGGGPNPQVYSVGVKALFRFPGKSPFGIRRAAHAMGFPLPSDVFGGGFVYSMGESLTAAGIIIGLDWPYGDLNPFEAFGSFRAHPMIAKWLAGGVPMATGARTIPEGGLYSFSRLYAPGALVTGDAAGFVNMAKIKGLHYAIIAGGAAGETAAEAVLDSDPSEARLAVYEKKIADLGLKAEFDKARNYRQVFQWGLYFGAPLSLVQRLIPMRVPIEDDAESLEPGMRLDRRASEGADQAAFVGLTGTHHREDEPSHITILDPAKCAECEEKYSSACTHFCPGQVYRRNAEGIVLSPSNCLHCGTCADKCPFRLIRWRAPEGGEGPRFTMM